MQTFFTPRLYPELEIELLLAQPCGRAVLHIESTSFHYISPMLGERCHIRGIIMRR